MHTSGIMEEAAENIDFYDKMPSFSKKFAW